jgi:hypothetical protein
VINLFKMMIVYYFCILTVKLGSNEIPEELGDLQHFVLGDLQHF